MKRLLRLGIIILFGLINAAIFALLWYWHVVPLGLPKIRLGRALGIMTMIEATTYRETTDAAGHNDMPLREAIATRAAFSVMFLAFGWVATLL